MVDQQAFPVHNRPRRILVVEDEYLLAVFLDHALQALGFEVVGPAPTTQQARALTAGTAVDAAILDFELDGETTSDFALGLRRRAVPVVFVSANAAGAPAALRSFQWLTKPYSLRQLERALSLAFAAVREQRAPGDLKRFDGLDSC